MTHEDFDKLLEERLEKSRQVLASKSKEYATAGDKLHNFKRAGEIQRCHPAKALVGMWSKHLVSILDLVDKHVAGEKIDTSVLDEKIGDGVNYLILLEGILKE